MRKVDVVLVVLGVLASGATAAAIVKSDDWTGERTYRFSMTTTDMAAAAPMAAGSAPARFEVVAPTNATGTAAVVTVDFTGQAVQGGSATIRVSGTAPDGSALPTVTRAWPVSGTSGSVSVPYNATWLEVPDKVRDTRSPDATQWTRPMVIMVTVERPGDVPLATYAFTATIAGQFTAYAAA